MTSTSRVRLSGDEVEKILDKVLSYSKNSLFDSDDDSILIEDLPIQEEIAIEESEDGDSDSAQNSTSDLQGGASGSIFTWEDMSNYVRRT
jgi:hypothetical protein